MRRLACIAFATALAACALAPAAQADFGLRHFDVAFSADESGTPVQQAGSHPYAMTTTLVPELGEDGLPDGWLRDFIGEQVTGLVGDTTAYERCGTLDFLTEVEGLPDCPDESALGVNATSTFGGWFVAPVFNLEPPPGVLLRIGFRAAVENIVVDVRLGTEPPHSPIATSRNVPQLVRVFANILQLWGDPSDPRHDRFRGRCGGEVNEAVPAGDWEAFQFTPDDSTCPVAPNPKPLLTVPGTCTEPLRSSYVAFSWAGERDSGSSLLHDAAGTPRAFDGCERLGIENASLGAQPTNRAAESPSGLDLAIEVEDEGLTSTKAEHAGSTIREIRVTLPEGMTANPSLAEGLEVCSEADLDDETLHSAPGEGCPQASKIGTLEVESPLVEEPVSGALYQAEPHANLAGDSLLAFYVVFKNPKLGIIVKQPTRVEPDPRTGQLVGIAEQIPQLPFSSFRLKFREGGRSPLITPPTCGDYRVRAELRPWSGTATVAETDDFEIVSGPHSGSCPPSGQPFVPGFAAGSHNNAAGAFSPFSMRLTRRDGDQDIVRFDAKLPKGVLARLAGVSWCPEAQIALAKAKDGRAELASPSCPLNSRIGRTITGAGVGSQLTYVPGTVYLAGPFAGAPLSAVAIVPAVAGPFDVGTVVVRQALRVDPVSGEVTADGALSDPIPHILAGIPLRVRDIQVHIDRLAFTLNPTSCAPMATFAGIWGGGQHPFSTLDDAPVSLAAPYQAAGCAHLGFKPRLGLRLKGGTRRGANPALRAVLRPRAGHANIERTIVRLPRSAFLDQAHIRTICTRVQFAADACPKGAVYGRVAAFSPLLDQPLRGPAYLRSSNNQLPDLVFDLKGIVEIEASARIDSVRGGIRATFAGIPDAPLSKVVVRMQGGKKGLIVNSRHLCRGKARAHVRLDAHNGARTVLRPVVRPQCGKKGKGKGRGGKKRSSGQRAR